MRKRIWQEIKQLSTTAASESAPHQTIQDTHKQIINLIKPKFLP